MQALVYHAPGLADVLQVYDTFSRAAETRALNVKVEA